ncbi:MAG: chemotaxis protein CheW [Candidatus Omnitrophica bacterium]|nr:chemotaxis protein CheW [Candidatus Omnitrophota bacterium]
MRGTTYKDDSQTENILQLVCFKLADEEYAVDITQVQEVIRMQRITPVPQMPGFVLGVVNIRGTVVPVFDLRKQFHLTEKEENPLTKIVVVNLNGELISIIVDEILDNIKLDSIHVDPTPAVKMEIDKESIKGIGMLEERMIIILDLHKINDSINRRIVAFKSNI